MMLWLMSVCLAVAEIPADLAELTAWREQGLVDADEAEQLAGWLAAPVDLNRASRAELARLPLMTPDRADAVIAGRPYADVADFIAAASIAEDVALALAPLVTVHASADTHRAWQGAARAATLWHSAAATTSALSAGLQQTSRIASELWLTGPGIASPEPAPGLAMPRAVARLQLEHLGMWAGHYTVGFGEGLTLDVTHRSVAAGVRPASSPHLDLRSGALRVPRAIVGGAVVYDPEAGWNAAVLGGWPAPTPIAAPIVGAAVSYRWFSAGELGAISYASAMGAMAGVWGRGAWRMWDGAFEYVHGLPGAAAYVLRAGVAPWPWLVTEIVYRHEDASFVNPWARGGSWRGRWRRGAALRLGLITPSWQLMQRVTWDTSKESSRFILTQTGRLNLSARESALASWRWRTAAVPIATVGLVTRRLQHLDLAGYAGLRDNGAAARVWTRLGWHHRAGGRLHALAGLGWSTAPQARRMRWQWSVQCWQRFGDVLALSAGWGAWYDASAQWIHGVRVALEAVGDVF